MKMIKYILGVILGSGLFLASCSDFLDTAPDTRTELENVETVRKLLVGSYPSANYSIIAEFSSDNIVDNNAPHIDPDDSTKIYYYNLQEMTKMYNELFAFEVVSSSEFDSPASVWEDYYRSIASVNHALEALDKIEREQELSVSDKALADACRGEALLIRAYCHFTLVNLFSKAYKNDVASKNDIGIPYITTPETDLIVSYDRGNVADVYSMIEKDLVEALSLVSDVYYNVIPYRFNKNAAYAFATRFYLFKRDYDKVIYYANKVLGEGPGTTGDLRDYSLFTDVTYISDYVPLWSDVNCPSNLLLLTTVSLELRAYISNRYAHNHEAARGALWGIGPSWDWTIHPMFIATGYYPNGGNPDYGLFSLKVAEDFQVVNKLAGTGTPRIIKMEFTKEEVLLSRAEAYLLGSSHDIDAAFADLDAWEKNMRRAPENVNMKYKDFTKEAILKFYNKDFSSYNKYSSLNTYDYENTSKMSPEFIVPENVKPYLNCCLHFRRLEKLHTGMRFFDLKRFGLTWKHEIGKKEDIMEAERTIELSWDDELKALEIPQDALIMGLPSSRKEQPSINTKLDNKVWPNTVKKINK